MSAKKSTVKYMCSDCGAESTQWMGRCPVCGAWNTMEEFTITEEKHYPVALKETGGKAQKASRLSEIHLGSEARNILDMPEVDRTLGGGIVPGSVILFGGEPGIGKSTLILQLCHAVSKKGTKALYCTGEESERQIKMRADRLHIGEDECFILADGNLTHIVETVEKLSPDFVVIDSIQTMYVPENDSPIGSPNQIKSCTSALVKLAKMKNITVLIVGHVTKEGNLAGPRMLEHMVDVVLYLEGDRSYQFRVLRTVKNRFGPTSETGLFIMKEDGLMGIKDPSGFLVRERKNPVAGSAITSCMEGQRAIMVEIQALAVHSVLSMPRRISVGFDYSRMIVLLAVLEKRAHIRLSQSDVYVNVASGFKVQETAADLSAAMAIVSAHWDIPVPPGVIAAGEISLTGEILPVTHVLARIKEAQRMHFTVFLLPEGNREEVEAWLSTQKDKETCHPVYVSQLSEAVSWMKQKKVTNQNIQG